MVGVPAKQRDALSDEQAERVGGIPRRYVRVSRVYRDIVNSSENIDMEDATGEY
jgi:hypothetical protein